MEPVQRDHWCYMVLFFILPLLKAAVQENGDNVVVRLEEGMVLDCRCPWDGNLSMVSWTKSPSKSSIAVFHPELGEHFSQLYLQRMTFLRSAPMDGSLSMVNVTREDVGVYHCSVHTFPRGSWSRVVLVEDAATVDEPPEADTELVTRRGDDATLRCSLAANGTVRQVFVERYVRGRLHPWEALASRRAADGAPPSEGHASRAGVNCTDSLDACSLQLTGVAEEDGGLYRCRFVSHAGVQSTNMLLLTVLGPVEFSLSEYMMFIYIGSGAASFLLFTVFLTLAVRHRKRNRRLEYRVKLNPSQTRQSNDYNKVHKHNWMPVRQEHVKDCHHVYANVPRRPTHKSVRCAKS